eukprot:363244-Chlamydomonas_euryale.AAC.4
MKLKIKFSSARPAGVPPDNGSAAGSAPTPASASLHADGPLDMHAAGTAGTKRKAEPGMEGAAKRPALQHVHPHAGTAHRGADDGGVAEHASQGLDASRAQALPEDSAGAPCSSSAAPGFRKITLKRPQGGNGGAASTGDMAHDAGGMDAPSPLQGEPMSARQLKQQEREHAAAARADAKMREKVCACVFVCVAAACSTRASRYGAHISKQARRTMQAGTMHHACVHEVPCKQAGRTMQACMKYHVFMIMDHVCMRDGT